MPASATMWTTDEALESEDQCMLQDAGEGHEWGRAGHCPLHQWSVS